MDNPLAASFLNHSCRKLEEATGTLKTCLSRLTDAQVWERHAPHENAIGNLVLHLCGNARQWINHGIGGAADVRRRDDEFSASEGISASALMDLFDSTLTETRSIVLQLTPGRLGETIHPQGRTVTVLEAVYQVTGHVQQHMGQIILLTKQMTGTDLDLTMPRPR